VIQFVSETDKDLLLFSRLSDAVTGDIGGYLGLLIGGSALTILELVDLVFYNALLKFIGKA